MCVKLHTRAHEREIMLNLCQLLSICKQNSMVFFNSFPQTISLIILNHVWDPRSQILPLSSSAVTQIETTNKFVLPTLLVYFCQTWEDKSQSKTSTLYLPYQNLHEAKQACLILAKIFFQI
jgi:hypothetical protein